MQLLKFKTTNQICTFRLSKKVDDLRYCRFYRTTFITIISESITFSMIKIIITLFSTIY